MNKCPCCSDTLLKHAKSSTTYWYCGNCRQEMPNLEKIDIVKNYQKQGFKILNRLSPSTQLLSGVTQIV